MKDGGVNVKYYVRDQRVLLRTSIVPLMVAGLRHMKWIQKAVHLLFIQQVFLQNQIPDGGTGLYGLLSNICSFLIADIRQMAVMMPTLFSTR